MRHPPTDQETEVALERAFAAWEQPTVSTHCPYLDSRGNQEQRATEGAMEKTVEGERQKITFTI